MKFSIGKKTGNSGGSISKKKGANLLFITFDQWRGDWLGTRNEIIKLKEIEKIRKQGWTAERCYTSSPQCVPARLSWITSLKPSELGITENQPVDLPGESPSIIRTLRDSGWQTALVGKTHWSSHNKKCDLRDRKETLRELGIDITIEIAGPRALQIVQCEITDAWKKEGVYQKHIDDLKKRYKSGRNRSAWKVSETKLPLHLYPDIWVTNKAIEVLDAMPIDQKWILWVSFVGPHEPFDTPKPWKGTHHSSDLPEPNEDNGWIDRLKDDCNLKKIRTSWSGKINTQDKNDLRVDYADHLTLLDDQVGRLMNALNKRQDAHKTSVAITADHGEMLGDHNMLYKSTFLEESIRVPFIYMPPQIKTNKKDQHVETKPIGLTEAINFVFNNLKDGGRVGPMRKWAKRNDLVISEFKDEIMMVKDWDKLVCNMKGEILWWTNTKRDPKEQINLLENVTGLRKKIRLKRLARRIRKKVKERTKMNWIKIDLRGLH